MASSGIIRPARRPPGWCAPGPEPAGSQGDADLQPHDDEDLCYLVGNWRIFQRQRGHRWSLDDLVTAWFSHRACERLALQPSRILDLGCGIGSVLLIHAWAFAQATIFGVEAQAISIHLARRSLRFNGVDARIQVLHRDFRDVVWDPSQPFDLITGTPPYFSVSAGLISEGEQKGPCRFEERGGVEDYIACAARCLAPHGLITLCAAASQLSRIEQAAALNQLDVRYQLTVVPKAGKEPLIVVVVLVPTNSNPAHVRSEETLIVRDANGVRTAAMQALRASLGMPP